MNNQITDLKALKKLDFLNLFFISLYIFIDFIPFEPQYSMSEPQWYYLSLINIITLGYLLYSKQFVLQFPKNFKLVNIPGICSVIFILISGLSIIKHINLFEGIITLSRYLIAFTAAANLYLLFRDRKHLLYFTFTIISFLLLFQVLRAFGLLKTNMLKMNYADMISEVKFNHSNKNVFSSIILLKLPIVLYCVLNSTSYKKAIHFVSFVLGLILLYVLSTRALIIGSVVIFVFFTLVSFRYTLVNLRTNFSILAVLLSCGLLYFLIVTSTKKVVIADKTTNIALNTQSLNLRVNFWKSSLVEIKENPLLGCGIGNWKIHSLKHEYKWKNTNSNSIHLHNDYLEVTAEAGILAGLAFLGILASILFLNVRTIVKTQDKDKKLLATLLTMSILGYCVDSFFNFPLARATPLMPLLIVAVITIALNRIEDSRGSGTLSSNLILGLLFAVGLCNVYPNYIQNEFSKGFNAFKIDEGQLLMTYDEVEKLLPQYPTLDVAGNSVACMKANYLLKEGKLKEALVLIEKGLKQNPYSFYPYVMKALTFSKMQKQDSVIFYNTKLHNMMPCYHPFYETYIDNLSLTKDTTKILNTFRALDLNLVEPMYFKSTFARLIKSDYNVTKALGILKMGQKLHPYDTTLSNLITRTKKVVDALKNFEQKKATKKVDGELDFSQLIQQYLVMYQANPTDYLNIQNIAVCYIKLNQFSQAVPFLEKIIQAKAFDDGKSQYMVALCYHRLNQPEKACENARFALSKNFFPVETQAIITATCK